MTTFDDTQRRFDKRAPYDIYFIPCPRSYINLHIEYDIKYTKVHKGAWMSYLLWMTLRQNGFQDLLQLNSMLSFIQSLLRLNKLYLFVSLYTVCNIRVIHVVVSLPFNRPASMVMSNMPSCSSVTEQISMSKIL